MTIPEFTEDQKREWHNRDNFEHNWKIFEAKLQNPIAKQFFSHLDREHYETLTDTMCFVEEYLRNHPSFSIDFTEEEVRHFLFALGQRSIFCQAKAIHRVFSDRLSLFLKGFRDPEPDVLAKQLNERYMVLK